MLSVTRSALGFIAMVLILASSVPAIAQQTQIANGVAYSNRYPSPDFATRVNACLADAASGAASSHLCDSTGEAVKQTITSQINIGTKPASAVTWIHSASCLWQVNMTDGKQFAFLQFDGSRVSGPSQQRRGCEVVNISPRGGLMGLYSNAGSGYYEFGNFTLRGNSPMSGKAVMQINGGFDNSYYHDITILNYVGGSIGLFIGGSGPCCSLMLERMTVYGNDTGGAQVDIEGHGASEPVAIWFYNSSFGHPAAGQPILRCHDSGVPFTTSIGFFGLYEEVKGSLAGVPLNQVDGCVNVVAHGVTLEAVNQATTKLVPGWSFTNAFPTAINITGLTMNHGFISPNPAIVTPGNVTINTDTHGGLASYTSNVSYSDAVGLTLRTPSNAERCTPGSIVATDADFLYVCTAPGVVKRAKLSTY